MEAYGTDFAYFSPRKYQGKKGLDVKINGVSMVPKINPGDIVNLSICNHLDLRKGDIIAFWKDSNLMVHRLWGGKGDFFITKGDRCRYFDDPVRLERVFGRVESVTRIRENNWNIKVFLKRLIDASITSVYSIYAGLKIKKAVSTLP